MPGKPECEIIDCHIHPAVDAATGFSWFVDVGDAADQVAALRRAGIHRACGSLIRTVPPSPGTWVRTV